MEEKIVGRKKGSLEACETTTLAALVHQHRVTRRQIGDITLSTRSMAIPYKTIVRKGCVKSPGRAHPHNGL
jgi:hypothetical protein